MSHSFQNADRKTHAKVIFAAVLCSAVAVTCLALGSRGAGVSTTQVVKAKATVDVSNSSLNTVR
jgi:hypothetical protein